MGPTQRGGSRFGERRCRPAISSLSSITTPRFGDAPLANWRTCSWVENREPRRLRGVRNSGLQAARRLIVVPEARIIHHVDGSRTTIRRFVSRCYFEGGSKAVIACLLGAGDALASERRYTREVLPCAMRWSIGDFVSGRDRAGIARAGCILAGLTSAAVGYGVGRLAPERAAVKRGWNGSALNAETVTRNTENEDSTA
jgi:hypothetical protein